MSRTSASIRAEPVGPSRSICSAGQVALGDDPGADGVVDVVVDVGDAVDEPDDPALERRRLQRAGVVEDPVPHLLGQVEAGAAPLEVLDQPQRVLVVAEAGAAALLQRVVEHLLADVAERRMAEVVPEADRLGQILVEAERPGDGPGDEARLERVGEPRPVVVALGGDEDLRLVLEAPERLRVGDPVAVALKRGPDRAVGLGLEPMGRIGAGRRLPEELLLDAPGSAARTAMRRRRSRRPQATARRLTCA